MKPAPLQRDQLPPTPIPVRSLGLRGKILLFVLFLGVLPTLLTLVVATATALSVLRSYALEQARGTAYTVAERLGEDIQAEASALRALLADARFVRVLERSARSGSEGPSLPPSAPLRIPADLAASLPETTLHLLGADGFYGGWSKGRFEVGVRPPPRAAEAIQSAARLLEAEGVGVVETPLGEDGTDYQLIARVPRPPDEPTLWVSTALRSTRVEERLRTYGTSGKGEIAVWSSGAGLIYPVKPDADLQALVNSDVLGSSVLPGEVALPGKPLAAWVVARVGAMGALTRPTGPELSLAVLHRIDFEPAANALQYGVWRIVLAGLLFIGLIGALGIWLSSRAMEPILQLRAGFSRIENGDLDFTIDLRTGDEIQDLATSMNSMALTLRGTYQNLADKLLELDEKARQLSITYEIAKAINQSLNLERLLQDIITEIHQLVPAERLIVCLHGEEGRGLEVAYAWPREGRIQPGGALDSEASLSRAAFEAGAPVVLPMHATGTSPEERLLAGSGCREVCIVPLRTRTGTVGVLLLADSLEGGFRRQELDILERLSESLATAVEHSRLYAQQSRFASELERQVLERTTALQRAQAQLLQVEKLAAAGELAANVAHEINNPLSIIKNYLKLLQGELVRPRRDTENSEIIRDGVSIIGEEIDRIARIVNQLRRIGTPQPQDVTSLDLNEELNVLMQLFRHTLTQKEIELRTDFDPHIDSVRLVQDHLRQIVINLLRNAYDATQPGGMVTIRTQLSPSEAGMFILSVRDTGSGILPEHLGRLFDPFFTTKKDGKGTGLGLSVSYQLARQMGGRLEASSEGEGRGAEFRLVLPLRPARSADTDSGEDNPVIRRQGARIIIG